MGLLEFPTRAGEVLRLGYGHVPARSSSPGTQNCSELSCASLSRGDSNTTGGPPGVNWEPPHSAKHEPWCAGAHLEPWIVVMCCDHPPWLAKDVSFSSCATAPCWFPSHEGFHVCSCDNLLTKGLGFLQAWDVSVFFFFFCYNICYNFLLFCIIFTR